MIELTLIIPELAAAIAVPSTFPDTRSDASNEGGRGNEDDGAAVSTHNIPVKPYTHLRPSEHMQDV